MYIILGVVMFVIICYKEVYDKHGEDIVDDNDEDLLYYFRDRKQFRIYVRIYSECFKYLFYFVVLENEDCDIGGFVK